MEKNMDLAAREFMEHFYKEFDVDRADVVKWYREGSELTYEGRKFQGQVSIRAKLNSLPFQKCWHYISSIDCQPLNPNGVLVLVTGQLKVPNKQKGRKFSQVFHLKLTPQGSFYVLKDIFRFNSP